MLRHDDNADNAHNELRVATNRAALFPARIAFGGYYIEPFNRRFLAGVEPALTNLISLLYH